MRVLRTLGVPYKDADIDNIRVSVATQEKAIVDDLAKSGARVAPEREIVALIAYLQGLGKSEKIPVPQDAAGNGAIAVP